MQSQPLFYFFWEKNEFWGITQNWVMTVPDRESITTTEN
jgi:hypothetical protein